jgi:hypothetical protein
MELQHILTKRRSGFGLNELLGPTATTLFMDVTLHRFAHAFGDDETEPVTTAEYYRVLLLSLQHTQGRQSLGELSAAAMPPQELR